MNVVDGCLNTLDGLILMNKVAQIGEGRGYGCNSPPIQRIQVTTSILSQRYLWHTLDRLRASKP